MKSKISPHIHHAWTVPLSGFTSAYAVLYVLSDKATELIEKTEVAQACLDLIQSILPIFN